MLQFHWPYMLHWPRTKFPRRVCIAQSSGDCLLGEVTISDCLAVAQRDSTGALCPVDGAPEAASNFMLNPSNMCKHKIEDVTEFDCYNHFYAWVLVNPVAYPKPVMYYPKRGCVVFAEITGRVPLDSPQSATCMIFFAPNIGATNKDTIILTFFSSYIVRCEFFSRKVTEPFSFERNAIIKTPSSWTCHI